MPIKANIPINRYVKYSQKIKIFVLIKNVIICEL